VRYLLVRLGALGDIVHAIPVAAAIRRAFPTAGIDWLVSAKHRDILDLVPVVDRRLVVVDRRDNVHGRGTSLVAAIRELRKNRYDVVFDLQGLVKSALLARASGAARVIGFSSAYLREPIARAFYTEVHDPGRGGMYAAGETSHVVQMNLGMLEHLGITAGVPEFPIEETVSPVAAQTIGQLAGRYMVLNAGAAWPNKRWPPQRFGALARELREREGLMSLVAWGPGEEMLADEVVRSAGGAAIRSPRTSIGDLVALLRGAAVMVSGDTGPTHIAAAVGTPLVGIYGPTRPSRNGPWAVRDITVSRADTCECHHLRRCRRETMCLLDIGVDEVADAVSRRLSSSSASRA
jgi:heptosyltransferase-1